MDIYTFNRIMKLDCFLITTSKLLWDTVLHIDSVRIVYIMYIQVQYCVMFSVKTVTVYTVIIYIIFSHTVNDTFVVWSYTTHVIIFDILLFFVKLLWSNDTKVKQSNLIREKIRSSKLVGVLHGKDLFMCFQ